MVWVMVIANIIGAVTLYPLSGYMGKLAFLRGSLLIPPIMVLSAVGAFLINGFWQDIVTAVFFGFFGYGMKRSKYPAAPLVLGFLLGPLAENYLHNSLISWGMGFLLRPIVLVLLILALLSLGYSVWQTYRERKNKEKIQEQTKSETFFAFLLLVIFIGGLFISKDWTLKSRTFPLLIVIVGALLSAWLAVSGLIHGHRSDLTDETSKFVEKEDPFQLTTEKIMPRNEFIMILWILCFLAVILFFGIWGSILGFVPLFMFIFGRENWKLVSLYTLCTWLGIYLVFSVGLEVSLYGGLLGLSW
jgi:MFS family permease